MSYGLHQPGLWPVFDSVAQEISRLDPDLVTVWNNRISRYEVYDRAAPGGPKWQLVMRVQTPTGGYRHISMRDVETIRRSRLGDERQVQRRIRQIEEAEEKMERAWETEVSEAALEMAEDLKFFGRAVVPSVAWRDRTPPEIRAKRREEIRSLAS